MGVLNPAVPCMGRSLTVTDPGGFRAEDWFSPRGLELVALARSRVHRGGGRGAAGVTNPAAAVDTLASLFADDEVPVARCPEAVRLAHGTVDVLPAVLSEVIAGQLAVPALMSPTPGRRADHFIGAHLGRGGVMTPGR